MWRTPDAFHVGELRVDSAGRADSRTQLGLGTAATEDTGITSGDVALLSTSGRFSTARLGSGTASSTTFLRGDQTWQTVAAGSFDIHDDVTTSATIADSDLVLFADEGTAGDPMRVTTASGLADYIQVEVQLNASRITAGTLPLARGGTAATSASGARTSLGLGSAATRDTGTASGDIALLGTGGDFDDARIPSLNASKITAGAFTTARIPNLAASKITSGTMGTARLGSGTASSTTYLRGDQTWAAVAAGTSFDIHDDLTVVTIADADRLAFSDENSFGDPMGYTTAAT